MSALLDIRGLTLNRGGRAILSDVRLRVDAGQSHVLLGAKHHPAALQRGLRHAFDNPRVVVGERRRLRSSCRRPRRRVVWWLHGWSRSLRCRRDDGTVLPEVWRGLCKLPEFRDSVAAKSTIVPGWI